MKKILFILLALAIMIPSACKKDNAEKDNAAEETLAKKYAKYRVSVHKDKDLKEWLATLEKTEEVDQLTPEEKYVNEKNKAFTLVKIKLADDKIGYIEARHLADKPIVFIEDTKCYVRPTVGTRVTATVPAGSVGFIISEKANWYEIYVGKVDGKWITKHWVNGGFSTDTEMIQQAKEYETALSLVDDKDTNKKEEGVEKLKDLSSGTSIFGSLARKKLDEMENKKSEELKNELGHGDELTPPDDQNQDTEVKTENN